MNQNELQKTIDKALENHDKYELRQICKNDEKALQYFIDKVMSDVATLEHIKNILK